MTHTRSAAVDLVEVLRILKINGYATVKRKRGNKQSIFVRIPSSSNPLFRVPTKRSREYKNSVASERAVSLSLSPSRASSCTTPIAATNSSQSRISPRTPRANSEARTSTNYRRTTAASTLPTDDGSNEATLPGTSTSIPDDRSGEGAVEARPRASALSSTWSGGQVQSSVSVATAADGFKRSRRGFSVGVWGAGEGATKGGERGRSESTTGRRGSFRFDGQVGLLDWFVFFTYTSIYRVMRDLWSSQVVTMTCMPLSSVYYGMNDRTL